MNKINKKIRYHLLNNNWGFSYLKDGILDMRYDSKSKAFKASDIVIIFQSIN